jgi:hypothetical protein
MAITERGASEMKRLVFGRYALSSSMAAAMLAGCGGSQPPIGAPGAMTFQASELGRARESSGYKVTAPLLYVTNYSAAYNNVTVYSANAKDPAPLATISDSVDTPSGDCIDGQGTLYVTNQPPSSGGWISEYPLGKTAPSKVIKSGVNTPAFCAIDAKGNLWVTNLGLDDVAEYAKGATKPRTLITNGLTFPVGIAIDQSDNLYVANGWDASQQNVQVYAPGSKSPSRTITDGVTWPVGISVDSKGILYVANAAQDNVEEYRSGQDDPFQTITKAMVHPVDVTVNRKGLLYVTNMGNNTVVEFPPGSLTPLKRQVSEGLYDPEGAAYYPAVLP